MWPVYVRRQGSPARFIKTFKCVDDCKKVDDPWCVISLKCDGQHQKIDNYDCVYGKNS